MLQRTPRLSRLGIPVVLLHGLLSSSVLAQHFPSNEDLTVMLQHLVEDDRFPGAVLGVLEADGTTRLVTYGNGGRGRADIGPESMFELGSTTKVLTGTLLADMVLRGEVSLDDPASMYLGDQVALPVGPGREITLRDMATHSSGLPQTPDNFPWLKLDSFGEYGVADFFDFLEGYQLPRAPGDSAEYSNYGVGLLGLVLAEAAEQPFRELLRERVLTPLGMIETGYASAEDWQDHEPIGHRWGAQNPYWSTTPAIEAAGGLRSNAEELLGFLAANVGEPTNSLEEAMRFAHQPRVSMPRGPQEVGVGLLWQTWDVEGRTILRHTGVSGGFNSLVAFDVERGIGVVAMANTVSSGGLRSLGIDLLTHDAAPRAPNFEVSRALLMDYAGEYAISPDLSVFVRLEDEGYLTLQSPSSERGRLYPESDSTFLHLRERWHVAFERSVDGAVAGVTIATQNGAQSGTMVGPATPTPASVAGFGGLGRTLRSALFSTVVTIASWGSFAWLLLALPFAAVFMLGRSVVRRRRARSP